MNTLRVFCVMGAMLVLTMPALAGAPQDVPADSRCRVCGMFVARYPNWLAQVQSSNGEVAYFDGVKDMMVFYFSPEKYGARAADIETVRVKDYYTLEWLDATTAYYVVGSDVHGPMGHEFIPFANKEAAQSFLQDHHGTAVITFDEITSEKVESMRMGMKMKKMKMH